ncbi:hypothetical protein [Peristeroidobacter agariperforans]|uniref:hypothetical protein n=1 Tax=Peristeroidobacter agariperforans TaxID=268404 RepID=UPI0018E5A29A|nr:hypothetical protein [Peristeroidobacter agariperforans]
MTMQRLCQQSALWVMAIVLVIFGSPASGDEDEGPVHSYPTQARVEYVNECIAKHDDSLANVYQCSCTIDRIADVLTYDEFVNAITFARYSGLPGEGGAVFRDSDEAKSTAKRFRELEKQVQRECGLQVK